MRKKINQYILYYLGEELSVSCGVIKEIKERKIIEHICSPEEGSSGNPIISLKAYKVVGIYFRGSINENDGIFIKYAIDQFINDENNKYKNEINIINKIEEKGNEKIYGEKLVKNNENNVDLINGKKVN